MDGERRGSTCRQNDVVTVVQVAVGGGSLNPLYSLSIAVVLELGQASWAGDRGDPRFFVVGESPRVLFLVLGLIFQPLSGRVAIHSRD